MTDKIVEGKVNKGGIDEAIAIIKANCQHAVIQVDEQVMIYGSELLEAIERAKKILWKMEGEL